MKNKTVFLFFFCITTTSSLAVEEYKYKKLAQERVSSPEPSHATNHKSKKGPLFRFFFKHPKSHYDTIFICTTAPTASDTHSFSVIGVVQLIK